MHDPHACAGRLWVDATSDEQLLLHWVQGTPTLEELKLRYYELLIRYHEHHVRSPCMLSQQLALATFVHDPFVRQEMTFWHVACLLGIQSQCALGYLQAT